MSARKLPQRMGFFPMFSAHIPNILAPHTNAWSTGLQRWWVFWQADVSLSERVIDFFNVLSSPIHQGILYQLVVSTRWKMMEWVKVSWDDYSIPFRIPFSEWIWMESQSKFHGSSHHQPAYFTHRKSQAIGGQENHLPKAFRMAFLSGAQLIGVNFRFQTLRGKKQISKKITYLCIYTKVLEVFR